MFNKFLSFILLIILISCASIDPRLRISDAPFAVMIVSEVEAKPNKKVKKPNKKVKKSKFYGSSGVIVKSTADVSYILTAHHACSPASKKIYVRMRSKSQAINFRMPFRAEIVSTGNMWEMDLCLLKIRRGGLSEVKLTKVEPKMGDKITNVSYPPDMCGYFYRQDGYLGDLYKEAFMATTIPLAGGSSGSGIFNMNSELVGIIVRRNNDFNNLGLAITFQNVKEYLEKNLPKD